MKVKFNIVILSLMITSLGSMSCSEQNKKEEEGKIKVACVGNSITFGHGIENREKNAYPAQLQKILGNEYIVQNFGVSGRTMLKKGDFPYWEENEFEEAQSFEPDIVIIKLGTNDAKPHNWELRDNFLKDYESMINVFKNLPSKPKIWVCLPAPVFSDESNIRDFVILNGIGPSIREVAGEYNIPVIDFYRIFEGKGDLFPDTIHPNKAGAKIMAETIAKAISNVE
ncbi:GDSL-type esterase/lipase family protein [Fulvivirgaceae bacterium BMA10]|uniref:GDSL-type esterase/lipase family protein n=1 Tax=Splendidivirga corallicola TaxID=3051826 RepID=A0ABT8KP29_9BACT|nr:GDSL-type esterase/lipase family protein [Fulvivirgaceae bacterium BMA10]